MTEFTSDWPDDADGDVFRRLVANGFDFSKPWSVDYNVDFSNWPPPAKAIEVLTEMYGEVTIYPPEDHFNGWLLFKCFGRVAYDDVIAVQLRATAAMRPYGGICETWGVFH